MVGCFFVEEEINGLTCCYLISSERKIKGVPEDWVTLTIPLVQPISKVDDVLIFDLLPGDWVKDLSSGVCLKKKIVIIKSWVVDCLVLK